MARKKETAEDKSLKQPPENKASATAKGTTRRCTCTARLSGDPAAHAPNCPARLDLKGN
jgi:hypothetical protein